MGLTADLVRSQDFQLCRVTNHWFGNARPRAIVVRLQSTESRGLHEKNQGYSGCEGVFPTTTWRVTGSQNGEASRLVDFQPGGSSNLYLDARRFSLISF